MRRKTELTGATTGWLAGPHAARRRHHEEAVLRALNGLLPVPAVIGADEGTLSMEFLDGEHGQDLLRGGWAAQVLRACGHTLRRIHAIDVTTVFGGEPTPPGTVLVHGDYGPNNILLDPDTLVVTAILDWEWAHPGDPLEDLAWCEWIVRSYHVEHINALDGFFTAYGSPPPRVAGTAPADGRPGAGAGGLHRAVGTR